MFAYRGWEWFKKFREAQAQKQALANAEVHSMAVAVRDLTCAVQIWTACIQNWTDKIAVVETFIVTTSATAIKAQAGTMKACEAIAIEVTSLREAVATFTKAVFGEHGREEALQKPDDTDRDRTFRQLQFQAAGKSAEDARTLAEEEASHEEAIQLSS